MLSRLFVFAIPAVSLLFVARIVAAPVEITAPELRGAVQPQVAVAPGGRIHVVFGKGNAIYHTASADGRSFSAMVKVAELKKLALGMRRGPRIVATDKIIAINAISQTGGDLDCWSSTDGGATWKEGANINNVPKSAREGLHAMAGDGQGNVFATWLDLRSGGAEMWGAASRDGGATWGTNALIYKSPDGHICECCHPSVAMDAAGRVAVMWRNWLGGARDLYLATSSDRGKTFGAAQKLGQGTWKLNGCPMDGGAVTLTGAGQPLAVWRRESTVFASETPRAERRLGDAAVQPVVAVGKGGAYLVWEKDGALMLQRGISAPARFADKARAASLATVPGRGVVAVWESSTTTPPALMAEIIP